MTRKKNKPWSDVTDVLVRVMLLTFLLVEVARARIVGKEVDRAMSTSEVVLLRPAVFI